MKDFKDNIDEGIMDSQKTDRFIGSAPSSHSFFQRTLRLLSRYSLLIIVGLAALSITVLHFQGKFLLQALRGTPLPTFWLEKVADAPALPDKTEVYQQVLAEEAKEAQQKRLTKPRWQASYSRPTISKDSVRKDSVTKNIASREPLPKQLPVVSKQSMSTAATSPVPPANDDSVVVVSFFQAVRVESIPSDGRPFVSCVVHGDQEVSNRTRLVLRLTQATTVNDKKYLAGTLVYGMARLSQDRIQVTISRIGQQAVSYQVHDHTYHAGILLDEREGVVQDATEQTTYRQGRRMAGQLPTQVASDLARSLLQRSRREKQSVFLPDGYPVYISPR